MILQPEMGRVKMNAGSLRGGGGFCYNKTPMRVRRAGEADIPAIVELAKSLGLDYPGMEKDRLWVAEEGKDGRIVGLVALKKHPDCLELCSLGVAPSERGKGIAKALVGALMAEARGHGPPGHRHPRLLRGPRLRAGAGRAPDLRREAEDGLVRRLRPAAMHRPPEKGVMNPPQYPDFKPVGPEDRGVIDGFLDAHPSEVCELNFPNILIWKGSERPRYTILNGNLCVLVEPTFEPAYFLPPVGRDRGREDGYGLPRPRPAPVARAGGVRPGPRRVLPRRGGPRQLRLRLSPGGPGRAQGQEVRRQAQPHPEVRVLVRPRLRAPLPRARRRLPPPALPMVRGKGERRPVHEGGEGRHPRGPGPVRGPRPRRRGRHRRGPGRGLHHRHAGSPPIRPSSRSRSPTRPSPAWLSGSTGSSSAGSGPTSGSSTASRMSASPACARPSSPTSPTISSRSTTFTNPNCFSRGASEMASTPECGLR